MAAELIATEGPLKGVVLALDEGQEWVLGRDPASCQLVLEDPKVARRALIIRLTQDGYSVETLSDLSFFINGRELKQAPLNDGDALKIGDTVFTFYQIEGFEEFVFGPTNEESPPDTEIDFTGDKPRVTNYRSDFETNDVESEDFEGEPPGKEQLEEGFESEAVAEKPKPGQQRSEKMDRAEEKEGFEEKPAAVKKQKKAKKAVEESLANDSSSEKAEEPKGPAEEDFVQEPDRSQKKSVKGPEEEIFVKEPAPKMTKKTKKPKEEVFVNEPRAENAEESKDPTEEGFASEPEVIQKKQLSQPEEEGFVEESVGKKKKSSSEAQQEDFAAEPETRSRDEEKKRAAEEGFVKEAESLRVKPAAGPSEEVFAEEAFEKSAPRAEEAAEESFAKEDQSNKDDWEIEEGEAEDFEMQEVDVSESPYTPKNPWEEEEPLVSEGLEANPKPLAEDEADWASEGVDSEEDWPQEPAGMGEQLSGEGLESTPSIPSADFENEELAESDQEDEPLFNPNDETGMIALDLTPSVRFLLKVIAGPNTGAEFALDMGREYLIGTEASSCDIVFHDLSVSREHARLFLSEQGELEIEDLKSRNGVLIDQEQIAGRVPLKPNLVISLGTSAFFIVDREAPQETIVAPTFEAPREQPKEEVVQEPVKPEVAAFKEAVVEPKALPKAGMGIYVSIVSGLAVLLAIAMISLFHTKELKAPPKDYLNEIREAVQDFPSVKYTYTPNSSRLFLVGHVATGIEKDELFYNLNSLSFLKGVDDHVVNDEAVWQETNILLSKQPDFKGVSMHSPRPGVFVLSGYMKNEKQAADLIDWMNIHFNYINLLENRVVVEEQVIDEVSSQLVHSGFGAVAVSFNTGELTLAGYVGSAQAYEFERLVNLFRQLPGVRQLQNFVVVVAPEQQVIDLSQRYPGRFKVTGYSKHGDVSINVVINGHILSRGDSLEGMTLTSIQPHAVFFEKDGLKYKLEYNK